MAAEPLIDTRIDSLTEVKEAAYLEYIRRMQPSFDSLTIDNCHDYLKHNHLAFVQIPHSEFCKKPTRFGDEIALRVHFNFRGKRIKWLILPLHESETDRHLIGLSG